MTNPKANRVREYRMTVGLSQAALAVEAMVTRQSIHAIESSRAVPAVDVALRIARALNCPVEALFGVAEAETSLKVEPCGKAQRGRVSLANIGSRWVSYPLDAESAERSADALAVAPKRGPLEVRLLRSATECRENVVIMGCAPALGILTARLNTTNGPGHFLWFSRSSMAALQALASQQSHLAGVHLVDARTGQANVADVRRHVTAQPTALVALGRWEVGLAVPEGNPKGLKRVEHLARKGVRLAGRELGSGIRQLLERKLSQAGLPLDIARNAHLQAASHRQVALAVSMGAADVGVTTRDVAMTFGLDFIALDEERFDLVLSQDSLSDPRVARLFEAMTSAAYRRELDSIGYDTSCCGDRVSDAAA